MLNLSYRPLQADDLPLLRDWICSPSWQEWWGNADEEIGYIKDMLDGKDTTRPFIFQLDDQPTGYIQYWSVDDQIALGWAEKEKWLLEVRGYIGVDLSIGDPQKFSKGLGTAILNRFSNDLIAKGYYDILIDPDMENTRAVRCYTKAGFKPLKDLKDKAEDCLIMRFDPDKGDQRTLND